MATTVVSAFRAALLPPASYVATLRRSLIPSSSFFSNEFCIRYPPPLLWRYLSTTAGFGGGGRSSSPPETRRRRLDVAIVGAPNSGKSQLLNALCGSTVAAVSRKRHTTRSGVLGARTAGDVQLVFVDTPGFLRKEDARAEGRHLGWELKNLSVEAERQLGAVDYTLVVVDAARRVDEGLREALAGLMLRAAASAGRVEVPDLEGEDDGGGAKPELVREKFAIVLNKVDLVNPKAKLLGLAADLGKMGDECVKYAERDDPSYRLKGEGDYVIPETIPVPETIAGDGQWRLEPGQKISEQERILMAMYPPVFYISARYNDGVKDVMKHLLDRATPTFEEWPVPPDRATLLTPLEQATEIIREKLYRCLHKEVPHRISQMNRIFRTAKREDGSLVVRIDQDLVVRTRSHRRLVTGRGGMTLKRIEETAKRDLEKALGGEVRLNLHVKLTKSSQDQPLEAERRIVVERKNVGDI